MSYKIESFRSFDKQLRRLVQKFPSLIHEYGSLITTLESIPKTGVPIGRSCYKIRLAIASKGSGKSGGARVITYVQVVGETVYLLAIYDKSEQSSISDQQVLRLLGLMDE